MKDEVLNFISNFRSENVFNIKCSYWFAEILFLRFIRKGSRIVFDKQNECFATMIDGNLYNSSGLVDSNKGRWVDWETYEDINNEIHNKYVWI